MVFIWLWVKNPGYPKPMGKMNNRLKPYKRKTNTLKNPINGTQKSLQPVVPLGFFILTHNWDVGELITLIGKENVYNL